MSNYLHRPSLGNWQTPWYVGEAKLPRVGSEHTTLCWPKARQGFRANPSVPKATKSHVVCLKKIMLCQVDQRPSVRFMDNHVLNHHVYYIAYKYLFPRHRSHIRLDRKSWWEKLPPAGHQRLPELSQISVVCRMFAGWSVVVLPWRPAP